MSFGAAAARRGPAEDAPCPCGGDVTYGGCCAPILRGANAETAEALMRSRYTAFAIGDVRHLLATWHPRTRPETLEIDARLRWTRLEIVSTEAGSDDQDSGVVEFRAHWQEARQVGVLHERSRFARVRGRWCYLDGRLV